MIFMDNDSRLMDHEFNKLFMHYLFLILYLHILMRLCISLDLYIILVVTIYIHLLC